MSQDIHLEVPRDVAPKLGYYVYLLLDPRTRAVFYVGKGKAGRALSHLQDAEQSKRSGRIQALRRGGLEPLVEILVHDLDSERAAYQIEAAVIDVLGLPTLTNLVRGKGARTFGRLPLSDLVALYRKRPVEIREPSILIRINDLYRPGMTSMELYDATRGVWKVASWRREVTEYAFAVFAGVIREVYEIKQWLPAGSTLSSRAPEDLRDPDKWGFVGRLAPDAMRRRYLDRWIGHRFKPGGRNPIRYMNV